MHNIPHNKKTKEKMKQAWVKRKEKGLATGYWKGKSFSQDHLLNLSKSHLGQFGYWTGKKRPNMAGLNSLSWKGGKPICIECGKSINYKSTRCMLCNRKFYSQERCHLWKGGITLVNDFIRTSDKMKKWRATIFERDNYTCVWCGERGKKLNADHIKPFAFYPKIRFDINNGQTLCENCHKWKTKLDLSIFTKKVLELNYV